MRRTPYRRKSHHHRLVSTKQNPTPSYALAASPSRLARLPSAARPRGSSSSGLLDPLSVTASRRIRSGANYKWKKAKRSSLTCAVLDPRANIVRDTQVNLFDQKRREVERKGSNCVFQGGHRGAETLSDDVKSFGRLPREREKVANGSHSEKKKTRIVQWSIRYGNGKYRGYCSASSLLPIRTLAIPTNLRPCREQPYCVSIDRLPTMLSHSISALTSTIYLKGFFAHSMHTIFFRRLIFQVRKFKR